MRVPYFGRLLATYVINYLGDLAALVALAVLVYDETSSALATTGLFVAAQFVPAFLAPVLTARVDRCQPRRMLPLLFASEAVLFAALAAVAGDPWLPLVYALVLADGVLMLTARGITRATISSILKPSGQLRAGNGLINVGVAVACVAGVGAGGAVVGSLGPAAVLAADAASFAAVALIGATLPEVEMAVGEERLRERLRVGLVWFRSHTTIRLLILAEALALVFFTLIIPIEVVYAKETLATGDAGYGLFLACWSAGQVLGGIAFVGIKSVSARTTVLASTALIGGAYLGMASTHELWVACLFAILGGLGNGIQWVAVMTLLQGWTPDDLQAQATGFLESAASVATGAGFVIGGATAAIFSPSAAFAVAGVGVVALVLTAILARVSLSEAPALADDPARSLVELGPPIGEPSVTQ